MFLTKKTFKTIISWCLAFVVALLCANLISFFYRSGAGSIQRENAYSGSIRTPNSIIVRGAEGYGVNAVDENGYLNDSTLPLAEHYMLLMGSSHAEGLQVMQRDNMATVLNNLIEPGVRTVYNLGTAGQTLPLILEGFQAAIEEFPDSAAVLIEISQTDFPVADFQHAMDQTQYDPASSGKALDQSLGLTRRIRNNILGVLPVISQLRQQIESMEFGMPDAFGIQRLIAQYTADAAQSSAQAPVSSETSAAEYYETLNQALALMRAEYSNPIILLYHPNVAIMPDGTLAIARDMRYYEAYLTACENNDIVFVDTGDAFLKAYQEDYSVPFGFSNTTMLSGHLNRLGHKIVAEAFYEALTELQDQDKEKN